MLTSLFFLFADYFNSDGDLNAIFRDLDGSTTGVINSCVVPLTPFFSSYRCQERPEWAAQVCHEPFVQVYITNEDRANTNYALNTGEIRMFMMRDERPDYQHKMRGIPGADPSYWVPPFQNLY